MHFYAIFPIFWQFPVHLSKIHVVHVPTRIHSVQIKKNYENPSSRSWDYPSRIYIHTHIDKPFINIEIDFLISNSSIDLILSNFFRHTCWWNMRINIINLFAPTPVKSTLKRAIQKGNACWQLLYIFLFYTYWYVPPNQLNMCIIGVN